ncbi:MAG: protease pro-enzyme activation domain-containing protein [Terriglobales bacterium]
MPRIRPVALPLALLSILLLSTFSFAAADRIGGPIIVGQNVRMGGGVPMQARNATDEGQVDPSMQMSYITLLTTPSAAQKKAISQLLADQQNPHSASYHKWLTPAQYAERFGLTQNDMNKLTGWLESQGFTIVRTARGRNWIAFSGTAAQVEATFQTEIHNFNANGETHFANVTPISIPKALSGIVTGLRGLNNFRPKSQARRAVPAYSFSGGNYQFIAPGDITTMYDIATLYNNGIDGTGQKLVVAGETGIYQSDLTNFRQNFGLSAISCTVSGDIITACNTSNFKYVLVNGTATEIYGDLPEADLDIEWSGATARKAQVIYVTANSNTGTTWDSWYYAVDNQDTLGESVITMSYTSPCELAEDPGTGEFTIFSDEAELAQANAEGITFMNSAGDSGVAECDYQASLAEYGYAAAYPASSQYVTGVGGTLIPYTEYGSQYWSTSNGTGGGSAISYIPEQAWNDSLEFAIFCEANKTAGICQDNGVGAGPLLTDWDLMQENVIGIAAGGGGVSNCVVQDANSVCTSGFGQPAWQSGLDINAINPNGSGTTNTPARFYPDVSLLASANWPGYLVCTQTSPGAGSTCDSPTTGIQDLLTQCLTDHHSDYCSIYGGTSVSAPIFAGMVALLNQYVVAQGIQLTPGLGNINQTLYTLAANNATNGAFNPVTTAATGSYSNGAFCDPGKPVGPSGDPWPTALECPSSGTNLLSFNAYDYDPTTKYNLAVGLGSVNLSHLATALGATGASTTTTVSSSENPSNLGDSVTFTATVTTTGTETPSGTVTFKDGTATLGTGSLGCVCNGIVNSATTTYTTSALKAGSHSITAVYSGDSNNASSTSPPLTQVVNEQDFSFSGSVSDPPPASPGQTTVTSMTIQAVGSSTFLDTVTYSCSGLPTGATCSFNPTSGTIVNGTASPQTVAITVTTSGPFAGQAGGGVVHGTRRRAQNQAPLLWFTLTVPLAGIVFVGLGGRKISSGYKIAGLCLILVLGGFLVACGGGGGSSPPPIAVNVTPNPVNTLWPNLSGAPLQAQQFTANVTGTSNPGVTWTISSGGTTDTISSTGLYTAPTSVPPGAVIVTATSQADTTKTGSATVNIKTPTPSGNSTITVTVTEGSGGQAKTHSTTFTLAVQ